MIFMKDTINLKTCLVIISEEVITVAILNILQELKFQFKKSYTACTWYIQYNRYKQLKSIYAEGKINAWLKRETEIQVYE